MSEAISIKVWEENKISGSHARWYTGDGSIVGIMAFIDEDDLKM